jgi:hypothetical protein
MSTIFTQARKVQIGAPENVRNGNLRGRIDISAKRR